jgi:hypothetical protein
VSPVNEPATTKLKGAARAVQFTCLLWRQTRPSLAREKVFNDRRSLRRHKLLLDVLSMQLLE